MVKLRLKSTVTSAQLWGDKEERCDVQTDDELCGRVHCLLRLSGLQSLFPLSPQMFIHGKVKRLKDYVTHFPWRWQTCEKNDDSPWAFFLQKSDSVTVDAHLVAFNGHGKA